MIPENSYIKDDFRPDRSSQAGAIRWVFLSVGLNALGQILLKAAGSSVEDGPLLKLFLHPEVWAALAIYGLSAACWLWVLSRVDLSMAYPLLAMTFPIVAGLSMILFEEPVSFLRWVGVVIIVAGVWLLRRT